jgi:hypothetical protein
MRIALHEMAAWISQLCCFGTRSGSANPLHSINSWLNRFSTATHRTQKTGNDGHVMAGVWLRRVSDMLSAGDAESVP